MSNRKSMLWVVVHAVAVLLAGGSGLAVGQLEEFVLAPSDVPAWQNGFGASVAIDGHYIVVGAPGDDETGSGAGAVYVFKREGVAWVEQAKLVTAAASYNDALGSSVAISGDVVVAGAPHGDPEGGGYGQAFVFRRSGVNWPLDGRLTPPVPRIRDLFGSSVSIDDDVLVVGAPGWDFDGAAYVYRDYMGLFFEREDVLTPSDPDARVSFGAAVSISGDWIVVGYPWDDSVGENAGAVYLFRFDGEGSWVEEPKLTMTDPDFLGSFGRSVAIRGDRMVAVGGGTNHAGIPVGFAYVFRRDGIDWIQEARLSASDAALYDQFGSSVAIAENLIVVGAPGDDDAGDHAGSVYLFRRCATSWVELTKLTASNATPGACLGSNIATTCQHTVARRHVFTISGDCNGNGIPDGCESPGDFDGDDDADLIDFEQLHGCMTAPARGSLGSGCCFFDFDLDDDVDLKDLRFFQLTFTGP